MKNIILTLTVAASVAVAVKAQNPATEETRIPQRVVVVSGDTTKMKPEVVAVIYDSNDLKFHDPSAPRFLFLDRKGKIAFGIGGYIYATAAYNFAGSERTGSDFIPSQLPTPADPTERAALQFTARNSTIFFQLAGHSEKLGTFSAFIQTNFDDNRSRFMKLEQAYLKVGDVTAGLARTTFQDPASVPTVDTQGPCGEIDRKNVHLQYAPQFNEHWSAAIAVEDPHAMINNGDFTQSISQRVPDIPVYVQYSWNRTNHVRLSAMLRNLCYRDPRLQEVKYTQGYGVQLSGTSALGAGFTLFANAVYGRGITSYITDLSAYDLDLIPSATEPGKLIAPRTFSYNLGLRYDYCSRGFATLAWGQAILGDRGDLARDTYRQGIYASANVFYSIFSDCLVGLEYARGQRTNFNGDRGTGNRIMAAVRYTF
ncbi:MAG: hypothetical protein HDR45_02905 [Bacteroides sp.]|nr:hypothetical protein [Bacteroides sp.]MBD5416054.1 hypothetical protein [Bacteroides sp.]MBD5425131.1 hypothetical protein [Bacteroides sp.]MDE6222557.1 porin [Muribaculaceae bacterium]